MNGTVKRVVLGELQLRQLQPDGIGPTIDGDVVVFSGEQTFPMGSRVVITMNRIGPGTVKGHFVEEGWLGYYVLPDNPPTWWIGQHDGSHLGAEMSDCAMIFGRELKSE